VLLAALAAAPSRAATQDDGRAAVRLDGRALFRVGAGEEADAAARARRIEGRIAAILQEPGAASRPAEVRPRPEGGLTVVVAGVPVAAVLPADAEEAGVAPEALATRWGDRQEFCVERC
jgi:hypothetical protein